MPTRPVSDDHTQSLTEPYTVEEIDALLSKMPTYSSSGVDGIPVAALKLPRYPPLPDSNQQLGPRVVTPYITRLFNMISMASQQIPVTWRASYITPIHKKGPLEDKGNYRAIAVSCVLYRLYAKALNRRLIQWAERAGALPDEQFGFRPRRSAVQATWALRCIADHQRASPGKKVYCAMLDLTQAYDRVQPDILWAIMTQLGLPQCFLTQLQDMLAHSRYLVRMDGDVSTAFPANPGDPLIGLKQGCPLSPTLFNFYMVGLKHHLERACPGAGVKMVDALISFIMYADDILLVADSPKQLQDMITATDVYCKSLGQTINADKSEILVFGEKSSTTQWSCSSGPIKQLAEVKYLGIRFHYCNGTERTIQPTREKGNAVVGNTLSRLRQLGIKPHPGNLGFCTNMFKTFVFPVISYGSEVWGTAFLNPTQPLSNPLQHAQSYFLRCCLHVPPSTAHWVSLLESGEYPLQLYWLKRTLRFLSALCSSTSPLIIACLTSQHANPDSWLGRLISTLTIARSGPGSGIQGTRQPASLSNVLQIYVSAYKAHYLHVLRAYFPTDATNAEDPECQHRGVVAYLSWFWNGQWGARPAYMHDRTLKSHVLHTMLRFRTCTSDLPVHDHALLRVPYAERLCDCCSADHATVGNEPHYALRCITMDFLRMDYELPDYKGPDPLKFGRDMCFRTFMQQPNQRLLAAYIYAMFQRRRASQPVDDSPVGALTRASRRRRRPGTAATSHAPPSAHPDDFLMVAPHYMHDQYFRMVAPPGLCTDNNHQYHPVPGDGGVNAMYAKFLGRIHHMDTRHKHDHEDLFYLGPHTSVTQFDTLVSSPGALWLE